jgi:hypothetical protein
MNINPVFKHLTEAMLEQIAKAQDDYVFNILNDSGSEDMTKRQLKKDFWSIIGKHYNLTIINKAEPQPAQICDKCKDSK